MHVMTKDRKSISTSPASIGVMRLVILLFQYCEHESKAGRLSRQPRIQRYLRHVAWRSKLFPRQTRWHRGHVCFQQNRQGRLADRDGITIPALQPRMDWPVVKCRMDCYGLDAYLNEIALHSVIKAVAIEDQSRKPQQP